MLCAINRHHLSVAKPIWHIDVYIIVSTRHITVLLLFTVPIILISVASRSCVHASVCVCECVSVCCRLSVVFTSS